MNKVYRRLRQLLQPRSVDIPLPGSFGGAGPLRLHTDQGRDQIVMELAAHGWNSFERPVPAMVASCAQICDGVFFDIGANTGLYSLLAARAAPDLDIHAFEPYPPVSKILLANIALNALSARITVSSFALAEAAGTRSLFVPLQDHGLVESSCSLNADFKAEHSTTLPIQVTTIDDYIESTGIARLGLLKIDVESTEHQVIAGGERSIARDRPLIVLEVLHLADHHWLTGFCDRNGYRIYTLHPDAAQKRNQVAFDGGAWNQCFCPQEKVDVLRQCADAVGLRFEH